MSLDNPQIRAHTSQIWKVGGRGGDGRQSLTIDSATGSAPRCSSHRFRAAALSVGVAAQLVRIVLIRSRRPDPLGSSSRRLWMRRTLPPPRAAEMISPAARLGATRRWWPSRASTLASTNNLNHVIRAIFSAQTGAAAALHTGHSHGSCAARQRQYRAPQPPQRVSGPLHAAVACRRASFRVLSAYGSI